MSGMDKRGILLAITMALAVSANAASSWQEPSSEPAKPPANPPRAARPQRVRVSAGVSQGLLVKKVAPEYPEKARQARIQGTVLMRAEINKQGDIENLTVISGAPDLAESAVKAVKQWKYRPYLLEGEPVIVETQIQVNFALTR